MLALAGGCIERTVTHEWLGIELDMPRGTRTSNSGTYSPAGEGDQNPVFPGLVLISPDKGEYYVDLVQLPRPISPEGMKYVLERTPDYVGVTHEAKSAGGNWELRYRWRNPDKTVVELWHYYFEVGPEHYECKYDEGNTRNLELAKKICLSVRPRKHR